MKNHPFQLPLHALIFAWVLGLLLSQGTLQAEPQSEGCVQRGQAIDVTVVVENWREDAPRTVVVTHGLGGTLKGDRFHGLVVEIQRQLPEANVVLIDWSKASTAHRFGLPAPWIVARRIDEVARLATEKLRSLAVDPERVTLIGESFGNYVNGQIAAELGEVKHIIALNPANEFGGYAPSDLRRHARSAWSFHTHSPFDTNREISHVDLFLETPEDASPIAQHTYGIVWLTEQLKVGKIDWLNLEMAPPGAKHDAYRGMVTLQGELIDVVVPRVPATAVKAGTVIEDRLAGQQ